MYINEYIQKSNLLVKKSISENLQMVYTLNIVHLQFTTHTLSPFWFSSSQVRQDNIPEEEEMFTVNLTHVEKYPTEIVPSKLL